MTEVHHPNCPYGRMSLRQRNRALAASTPQLPAETNKAVEAVRFVAAHIKNEDDFKEVKDNRLLSQPQNTGRNHRGSTGPAEPLLRTTTTTNMAAANFVVKTCNN